MKSATGEMTWRFLQYQRRLEAWDRSGKTRCVSAHLAQGLGVDQVTVRKDLGGLGVMGKPRRGYSVQGLLEALSGFLGSVAPLDAVLYGEGALARLGVLEGSAGYSGFRVLGVFGPHEGTDVEGLTVRSEEDLGAFCAERKIRVGVLAVSEPEASAAAAEKLAEAGVVGIWNLGGVPGRVPEGVVLVSRRWDGDMAHLRSAMNKQEQCAVAQGGIHV